MKMIPGIENALKMMQMFNSSKDYQASFYCDGTQNPAIIRVMAHPVLSGGFVERAIATYHFKEDGSYNKEVHL